MKKKTFIKIFLVLCIIVLGSILIYLSVENFSLDTGATQPAIVGTLSTSGPNMWQFVPTQGYYGPVKINYVLSDGLRTYNNSIMLTVQQVLTRIMPETTSSPNYYQLTPSPFMTLVTRPASGLPFTYSFTTEQLWKMINPTGGEVVQDFDRVVIQNINSVLVRQDNIETLMPNSNYDTAVSNAQFSVSVSGGTPTVLQKTVAVPTALPAISGNTVGLNGTTVLTYTVPTDYPSPIKVSITYYLIDSINTGKTIQPNGTAIYGPYGPYVMNFTVPFIYRIPDIQPVSISILENTVGSSYPAQPLNSVMLDSLSVKPGSGALSITGVPQFFSCPAGQTLNGTGNTTLATSTGVCRPCDTGFYNSNGSGICIKCPTGLTSSSGSSVCRALQTMTAKIGLLPLTATGRYRSLSTNMLTMSNTVAQGLIGSSLDYLPLSNNTSNYLSINSPTSMISTNGLNNFNFINPWAKYSFTIRLVLRMCTAANVGFGSTDNYNQALSPSNLITGIGLYLINLTTNKYITLIRDTNSPVFPYQTPKITVNIGPLFTNGIPNTTDQFFIFLENIQGTSIASVSLFMDATSPTDSSSMTIEEVP